MGHGCASTARRSHLEVGTVLVTGAEPVLVSLLLVGSQGRSSGLCWVAELGSAALRAREEGRAGAHCSFSSGT